MVVNSINFWLFFIVVLIAYFGIFRKSSRWQNVTLLVSSYIFYGMVDWKMCLLLFISTVVFYLLGIKIARYNEDDEDKASHLTTFAVALGIGILFYFKYLGFFVEEFSKLLMSIGLQTNPTSFNIIMPLGISFFTFKLMGYAIEVHREEMEPSKDPIAFGTFIAFFPTIMSGPIDNPTKFIPQLGAARKINYNGISEGLKRILWGMFLKMCIADQLSGYTDAIFTYYTHHNSTTIIVAAILYAFQLYSDFSGYSEMAIGVSQVLGLRISENFNHPFFGQNIPEFWRRWHMSLTTWVTDYVYTPLNYSFRNYGKAGILLAVFINLLVVGAWHGANWTYLLFGVYHAVLFMMVLILDAKRKELEAQHRLKNRWYYKYPRMLLTFILVDIGMVLFLSTSVTQFFDILQAIATNGFGMPFGNHSAVLAIFSILILLAREWKEERTKARITCFIYSPNSIIEVISIVLLITYILVFGSLDGGSFIYTKF